MFVIQKCLQYAVKSEKEAYFCHAVKSEKEAYFCLRKQRKPVC